tara:strand:+ start:3112 stop:5259 length:2148 start_codon:yes stop_codon:yes gene_type:complete
MINGAHTRTDVEAVSIADIFKIDSNKTLVWDGFLPDGRKKQRWEDGALNWDLHLKGIKKQGGNLAYKNAAGEMVCQMAVIDIDAQGEDKISLTPEQAAAAAFKANTKLIPFKSPRGNWHMFYFFNKEFPVKEANKIIKIISTEFEQFKIKVDKVLPTATGSQCGINLPYCSEEQIPYDPRGNAYEVEQFINRIRFNNYPIIASVIGMKEGTGSRYQALCMAATELNIAGNYSDERILQINNTFKPALGSDDKFLNRIREDKIFEKYKFLTDETKAEWINQFTKIKDFTIPEDPEEPELEVFEYTGMEKIEPRPWLIEGWLLKKALTLLIGQPGIGKTMLLHMLAYALATGNQILLKTIIERGNVLIIAAEETLNEMNLRLKASSEMMGKNDGKFKIYKRGLENELKLVKFTKEGAQKTKQYKQLLKTIRRKDIKYIVLDPLINFQTGTYDENSNQNMDSYIKNYLIPIAVKMNGSIIAGHHTNKLSMVSTHNQELLVDNQNALTAARGASSLIGAARFVLALQPMTRKLWDDHFKEHVTDGSNFVHYTGLIEAKSNYNIIADDILWLKKNDVSVTTVDGFAEKTGCYSTTDLNKISKAKNKLKAAKNLQWCRSQMPTIVAMFKDKDRITLNSVVMELLPLDPDYANELVLEATIKTRIRRKIDNALSGKEETKDGLQMQGIAWDDGYNYWVKRDHTSAGAAKLFIERAVDFKRKK